MPSKHFLNHSCDYDEILVVILRTPETYIYLYILPLRGILKIPLQVIESS